MKQRVISAIVMLIIVIPFLIIGNTPFAVFIMLLGMVGLYELLKFKPKLPLIVKILTFLTTAVLICYGSKTDVILLGMDIRFLILPLVINLALLIFYNKSDKYTYKDAFYLLGISLFIGLSFGGLIRIRNTSLYLIIYLLLITTMTDTFSLFAGKLFGRHKLAKKISPNKTIEGLIGGTFIGTVIASLFYIFFIKDYTSIIVIPLFTLLLSLVGSYGDLIISSIKRQENIKDFSNLIPGHGGILDRMDSIIFVSLTYILIASLF